MASGRAVLDPATVQTNILVFGVSADAPDAARIVTLARERGVLPVAFGARRLRATTHLQVSREQCDRAAEFLVEVVESRSRSKACAIHFRMDRVTSWIERIPYAEATGRLRELYDRIRDPNGAIDNIMMAHSLRPHTMEGHLALYKSVLHHARNALPRWLLETAGVYVSLLNGCGYCVDHHFAGLRRLLSDDPRTDAIRSALEAGRPQDAFDGRELALLRYAAALTSRPATVDEALLDAMRAEGMSDGEILEANQVVAYFAYANRTVLGLGVTTVGDTLGLSPSAAEDPNDWTHR
jgi:uncharacterized peroxidase-related enzyme